MRRALPAFLAILLMTACATVGVIPSDERAVRSLIARTAAANNAGDVEEWVSLFDEEAIYMPPGGPAVSGEAELRRVAQSGFSAWKSAIEIEPEEVIVSGDWAFARTRVTGSVVPRAGGDAVAIDNKQIVVYRRGTDGRWRIARQITNANR